MKNTDFTFVFSAFLSKNKHFSALKHPEKCNFSRFFLFLTLKMTCFACI
jgi:hypothetical protein